MNKSDFLNRLQQELSGLTNEERREALGYYEEYFADAGEENEADVLLTLGSPEQVAERIKAGILKAEEGMFTESGYREKMESDNPPEVYGKKTEKEKGRVERERAGQSAGSCGGSWQNGDYNGNGHGFSFDDRKKGGMSGGMIALIAVLGILALPLVLGCGLGILGVVVGAFASIFAAVAAVVAVLAVLIAAGVGLFVAGFPMLLADPVGGVLCIAAGCLFIALFLMLFLSLWWICGKFFPWLIREAESCWKYLRGKWNERKWKGEKI